jgi:Tol biopolymer transport system component
VLPPPKTCRLFVFLVAACPAVPCVSQTITLFGVRETAPLEDADLQWSVQEPGTFVVLRDTRPNLPGPEVLVETSGLVYCDEGAVPHPETYFYRVEPAPVETLVFSMDSDIWIILPDGTGLEQVTTDPVREYAPAASPDGLHLVFLTENRELVTLNAGGSNRRVIFTAVDEMNTWPRYSPDGGRIAFAPGIDYNKVDICVIDVDGQNLETLVSDLNVGLNRSPSWYPTGGRLVFENRLSNSARHHQLFTLPSQGGAPNQITDGAATEAETTYQPSFSPDGQWLVFSRGHNICKAGTDGTDLTSAMEYLTVDGIFPGAPQYRHASWSPDGARIAFVRRDTDGSEGIYLMNADGTGVTPVYAGVSVDGLFWGILSR